MDLIPVINHSQYYKPGTVANRPAFALYDVTADCFLTVLPNEFVAIRLKYILSSRYHLHICRIDTASNYSVDLISNANCEQWSLTNRSDVKFSQPISNTIVAVDELCATREVASYDVFGEKIWCLFCARCLYVVHNEHDQDPDPAKHFTNLYWQYSKLDGYLNSFLDITEVDYPRSVVTTEIRNAVLKILYLERDFLKAEAEIKQLIKL